MRTILENFLRRRELKKTILPLWIEVNKNLERYYVMDQRDFIDMEFALDAWRSALNVSEIAWPDEWRLYIHRMEEFNRAFVDYREYEKWYISDAAHKTPENARTLHTKKNELKNKLSRLDLAIIPARDGFYLRLKELRMLKQ